jgi:plasmid stabilization system protein ParE
MAALTIKWTRQAIADIDNIYDFIAANNPRAARVIVDKIDRAITSLTVHPGLGRSGGAYEGRESFSWQAPHSSWPNRVRHQAIELLGVIHAARRWPDKL